MPVRPKVASAEEQLQSFIDKFDPKDQKQIRAVRKIVRGWFPTSNELVWDNYNFFVIGYSPTERPSDSVLSIAARAEKVAICFMHGKKLADPDKILNGQGSQVRFLRFDSTAELARPAVKRVVRDAVDQLKIPFPPSGGRKLIIRSVSAKQRPRRRPVAKKATPR
jgi:hypothetical protein